MDSSREHLLFIRSARQLSVAIPQVSVDESRVVTNAIIYSLFQIQSYNSITICFAYLPATAY